MIASLVLSMLMTAQTAPTKTFGECMRERLVCEVRGFKALNSAKELREDMADADCYVLKSCMRGFVGCLRSINKDKKEETGI